METELSLSEGKTTIISNTTLALTGKSSIKYSYAFDDKSRMIGSWLRSRTRMPPTKPPPKSCCILSVKAICINPSAPYGASRSTSSRTAQNLPLQWHMVHTLLMLVCKVSRVFIRLQVELRNLLWGAGLR